MKTFDRKISILVISLVTLISAGCTDAIIIGALAAKSAGEGMGKAIGQAIAVSIQQMFTPTLCPSGTDAQETCSKVTEKAYWTDNTPSNKAAKSYVSYEFVPSRDTKESGRVRVARWNTNARGALGEVDVGVIEVIGKNSITYRLVNSSCSNKRTAFNTKFVLGFEQTGKTTLRIWPWTSNKAVRLSRENRTLDDEKAAWGCL